MPPEELNTDSTPEVATQPSEVTDSTIDTFFDSGGEDGVQVESEAQENVAPVAEASEESTSESQESQELPTGSEQGEGEPESQKKTPAPTENQEQPTTPQEKKGDLGIALKAEREKTREVNSKLDAVNERLKQFENIFGQIMGPQKEGEPELKYEDDPIEYLRANQEKLAQAQAQQATERQQQQQQVQQQQAQQGLVNQYHQSASAYKETNPEFGEAYTFLMEGRMEEHQAAGYSREEASYLLHEDEMAIVAKAMNEGANPAERIHQLAKVRGFAQQAPVQKTPAQNTTKKLDTIERGMKKNMSIGSAQVGDSPNGVTLEQFANKAANMSDADFNASWDKLVKGGR